MEKIQFIAHRGGKGYGVENTKEAFLGAIKDHYDGVECDIQPTKDGHLVVFHDLDLQRLGGISQKVNALTLEELLRINLVKKDFNIIHHGNILPFDEFLEIFKTTAFYLLIEIKETCSFNDILKAINLIKEKKISFERIRIIANINTLHLLVELKKVFPDILTQYVARTNYLENMETCLTNDIGFDAALSILKDDIAKKYYIKFKERELETNIWVVNTSEELAIASKLKPKFITTDILNKSNE